MISVVTFVGFLMDSTLHPLVKQNPYQYSYTLVLPHFVELFYSVSQLEVLFVGREGLEPPRVVRHRIYSAARYQLRYISPIIYPKALS